MEESETWAREVQKCCKKTCVGDSGGISENSWEKKQSRLSCSNKGSLGDWTKSHLRYILAKTLPSFVSVLQLSGKLKLKVTNELCGEGNFTIL